MTLGLPFLPFKIILSPTLLTLSQGLLQLYFTWLLGLPPLLSKQICPSIVMFIYLGYLGKFCSINVWIEHFFFPCREPIYL
ncbi:hypothetical protein Patl1_34041 [Pistacia atlantica]|uniref:Uncharacterized protein n=1 Tax=Pistacia atlantica TaxID=434234 RepID=A0ACC0ZS32_9ROSI|nr:hypothetical protein Patl1_34041 [Pistacia atlantica]